MSNSECLAFIHMSDIHFRLHSGDPYDIDKPLRAAMINDVKNCALNHMQKVNGILVCGDLAYSGKEDEFRIANEFLVEVAEVSGCSLEDVFCVAGNHDVDQSVVRSSYVIETMQKELNRVDSENADDTDNLDNILRKIQQDPYIEGLLYKPIESYNKFADSLLCSYTVQKQNWERKMKLGDKYTLKLWGMNSVFISNHKDHQDDNGNWLMNGKEREMMMNCSQIPIPENNVIYMSLCHHPVQCWNNKRLGEMMDGRVKLQLYGHKHIQSIDADNRRIRIYTGALQPERGNDWIPLYNWITLSVIENKLIVRIYPRIYDNVKGTFCKDRKNCDTDREYKEFELLLDDYEDNYSIEEKHDVRKITSISKEIAYRYCTLSESEQENIIREFEQVDFKDKPIDELLQQLQQMQIENDFLAALKSFE